MDCKGTQNLRPTKHFAKKIARLYQNNGLDSNIVLNKFR